MKRSLFGIVVLITLIAIGVISSNTDKRSVDQEITTAQVTGEQEIGINEGNEAPDFTLYSLEGQEVKLSDYRGKVVFVNFWATWCPPCKAEMPHMEEFYKEYADQYDAEILAVNITSEESSTEMVDKFIQDYKITFPVLMDTDGMQSETFATITIPTTYVIDKNGIIMKRLVGPMSKERMIELASSAE
ncbi:peroxiredoxin family protein [Guptibacillus hwajinpoensis]|uniref:Thiol-disulfide isomerase/thioredoxin n=1 Tax=Guptibacillus hwajinpoensis TaxID=208199 RepID=A0ABU0K5T0_9BACL|nr:TlpA disulfide reductase family protein [Alkalihalobacillus hemicentroti]MDQ0484715.1 thiol-disulfide isomerase/thioredoxin [Alkalihalobacillus hemicentroti]